MSNLLLSSASLINDLMHFLQDPKSLDTLKRTVAEEIETSIGKNDKFQVRPILPAN